MSAAQHTPGPWTFSRDNQYGDERFYVAQAEGAPYTPNFSDVATLIAETVSIERVAIQEANARLIAESPEMLALLQHAVRHPMVTEGSEWWTKVRIVVAKATGGAA